MGPDLYAPAIGASYTNSYKHGSSVRLEGATTSIETIRFCFRCCIKKNRLRRHGGKQAARAACLPACLPACLLAGGFRQRKASVLVRNTERGSFHEHVHARIQYVYMAAILLCSNCFLCLHLKING